MQYYSWSHFICLISCVLCIIKSPSSHLRPLASSLCDTLTTLLHRFLSSPALDIASDDSYKRYDLTTCMITWSYVVETLLQMGNRLIETDRHSGVPASETAILKP